MKRYDQGDVGILVMITCILSLILGALIGVTFEENSIKRGAIKQGCAQYNPTTSDFEWLGDLK